MLDVKVEAGQAEAFDADAIIIFLTQDPDLSTGIASALDGALGGMLSDIVTGGDFAGKGEQVGVIYPRGAIPARRVLLVGVGKTEDVTPEAIRRASAAAVKRAQELGAVQAALTLPPGDSFLGAHAVVEGAMLSLWTYRGQKTTPDDSNKLTSIKVLVSEAELPAVQDGVKSGAAFARAAIIARDLANLPPNICTPAYLAERAVEIAVANGLRAEILEKGQILALRMCALLGVAQGSHNPPRFIVLQYNAPRATELETVVLVGKGVTFDTGGYSIKTADGMIGMKGDMSGAAAVLGAMQAVAELEIPLHVVGIVPAVENMIDSHAYRPQDVLTASNGKTIEIISTDAEGRLILADALVYASRFHPAAVVDIATLTGSIVTALGNVNGGLFSNDDSLRDAVMAAGNFVQERVWPMPLMPEYRKLIDSDTADMKNSAGAKGGACIAAAFLKEFVDYPRWAHIDMAGQFADIAGNPYINAKGMNGYGARLLTEFVRAWSTRKGAQE
jgi:leucyl aminopeptidase